MNKENLLLLAELLRKADAMDFVCLFSYEKYVEDDVTMSPLAAIYAMAMERVPYHWNNYAVANAQIIHDLLIATGIDFSVSVKGHQLFWLVESTSFQKKLDFQELADYLEYTFLQAL